MTAIIIIASVAIVTGAIVLAVCKVSGQADDILFFEDKREDNDE